MYFYMNKIPKFLIYDPLDQPLYRQYETYNASTYGDLVNRIKEHGKGQGGRAFKVRYVAYTDSDDEFERICRLVWQAPFPFIFIVEEVASHIRGHSMTKNFYKLVRQSRNQNKGIWVTTQHPKMIPPKFRNNVDVVFVFKLYEPESIDYAQKWFGTGYQPDSLDAYAYYMHVAAAGERRLIRYPPLRLSRVDKRKSTKKGAGFGTQDIEEELEE